ncbi:type II secretion system F family protein [Muricoccus aerilatus]|uniref:type II secretion system F family protein n=1 Tax=Muricoccus aerilatus TaxID=452982 RepID=UPI000A01E7DC|nr:type II secretion system F family protein [Roseomonas aerilata]
MSRELLSIVLFGLLLLCVLLCVVALRQSGDGNALRCRLRGLSGTAAEAGPTLPPRSIRVDRNRHGRLSTKLLSLIHFDHDMPQARSMPWPLVAVLAVAGGILTFSLVAGWLGTLVAASGGLVASIVCARFLFGWQRTRYADAVFQQIPDALGLMVRAIRAGLPLAEALRGVAREISSPTREEFVRVSGEMAIGRPVEEALAGLSARTGVKEYAFLAVTLGLQSQTGGSLAETLDNLADLVRKRVAMAKRARALAAEANMQAGMLVVLPFIAALAMSAIQPFYIETFTQNPTGRIMAGVGLFMMLLGLLTIRWLIRQAGRG